LYFVTSPGVQNPVESRDFSLFQNVQFNSAAHSFSLSMRTGVLPRIVKRPVVKLTIYLPSSAEIKNGWSNTFTPQYAFMAWTWKTLLLFSHYLTRRRMRQRVFRRVLPGVSKEFIASIFRVSS